MVPILETLYAVLKAVVPDKQIHLSLLVFPSLLLAQLMFEWMKQ